MALPHNVIGVPDQNPVFADIFGVDKLALLGGDAHDAPRRCAIVQVGVEYVTTLGRSTTEPHHPPDTLKSGIDPDCNLDRRGVFSLRWQHSVATKSFENPRLCSYYGHLKSTAETELRAFWDGHMYS
jgi:hypothetical protein